MHLTSHRSLNLCSHPSLAPSSLSSSSNSIPAKLCTKCGAAGTSTIKTIKYATAFHFNLKNYLSTLRKNSAKNGIKTKQLQQSTLTLLRSICEKFMFIDETLGLALYLYQTLHPKLTSLPWQPSPHLSSKSPLSLEKFWTSTCLVLAGKAQELDKNVPYLNRYQRYAQKSFTQDDYERGERQIFEMMGFEVNYATFVTFVEFYLMTGVVFQGDFLNGSNRRSLGGSGTSSSSCGSQLSQEQLATMVQNAINLKLKALLNTPSSSYFAINPQIAALSLVVQTRKEYNLVPWPAELQKISGYSLEDIEQNATPKVSQQEDEKKAEVVVPSVEKEDKYFGYLSAFKVDENTVARSATKQKSQEKSRVTMPLRQIWKNSILIDNREDTTTTKPQTTSATTRGLQLRMGVQPRKKYEYPTSLLSSSTSNMPPPARPLLQKYSSISKHHPSAHSNPFKQNISSSTSTTNNNHTATASSSKFLLHPLLLTHKNISATSGTHSYLHQQKQEESLNNGIGSNNRFSSVSSELMKRRS